MWKLSRQNLDDSFQKAALTEKPTEEQYNQYLSQMLSANPPGAKVRDEADAGGLRTTLADQNLIYAGDTLQLPNTDSIIQAQRALQPTAGLNDTSGATSSAGAQGEATAMPGQFEGGDPSKAPGVALSDLEPQGIATETLTGDEKTVADQADAAGTKNGHVTSDEIQAYQKDVGQKIDRGEVPLTREAVEKVEKEFKASMALAQKLSTDYEASTLSEVAKKVDMSQPTQEGGAPREGYNDGRVTVGELEAAKGRQTDPNLVKLIDQVLVEVKRRQPA